MFSPKKLLLILLASAVLAGCAKKPTPPVEPATRALPAVSQPEPLPNASLLESPAEVTVKAAGGVELETVHFAYDSSLLDDAARTALLRNAAWLNADKDRLVTIEGHCDERGSGEYNLALGEQRAQSVKNYLIALGVPPAQLNTISFGEEAPLDPGHGELAWAKNRRAAFK